MFKPGNRKTLADAVHVVCSALDTSGGFPDLAADVLIVDDTIIKKDTP